MQLEPPYRYYATLVPGLEGPAEDLVRSRLPGAQILRVLSGALLFECSCSYDKLNLLCFNNIFTPLDIKETGPGGDPEDLTQHPSQVLGLLSKNPGTYRDLMAPASTRIRSFRLFVSEENVPAPLEESLRRSLEATIGGLTGLRVERRGADTEFWFLRRREGLSLFMKRLTNKGGPKPRAGELSAPLAWLLCHLGGLGPAMRVLDPFSGYGAICEAALKFFPITSMYALDRDQQSLGAMLKKPSLKKFLESKRLIAQGGDFFDSSLPEDLDAIVSDPPWGIFKKTDGDLGEFYGKMLAHCHGLLKEGGRAVFLCGAPEDFEGALAGSPFRLSQSLPILVSGKKARVYVLEKKP
ncbi:MAG: methyltransferase [Treponema sp.]|nr:methyltransferase [Treponema sp.]